MSQTYTTPTPVRAALISVGGSPGPVLHVLGLHRPAHVWYLCSTSSRLKADEIQSQLDWHPQARFIEVAQFEELGPCYRVLRHKIREILTETQVPAGEVLVDYTGGTKTMSAALVLVAVECFRHFSYVGGEQREKGGLGVVLDGNERVLYQNNPWTDLAVREVERARDLWAACQFESAAHVLYEVAPHVPHQQRFKAIASLAEAMAARHRLDFSGAKRLLGPLNGSLPQLFDGRDDRGLLAFLKDSKDVCTACCADSASEVFLNEILENALRTAGQGRYEDAAARLYRAMEMRGQIWLAEQTGQLFHNGRCKAEDVTKLPTVLKQQHFCQPDDNGGIRLSLEQAFRALAALGHSQAQIIIADLDATDSNGKTKSRWRAATEKRNTSILAHGVQPIGREGFGQMKDIASDFLGFDFDNGPRIPEFDPEWLAL